MICLASEGGMAENKAAGASGPGCSGLLVVLLDSVCVHSLLPCYFGFLLALLQLANKKIPISHLIEK
jgi:hypothetical protein